MSEPRLLPAVIASLAIFCLCIGIGALAVWQDPALGEQVLGVLNEELFADILDDSPALISLKLFLNNLGACIILFLGGASAGLLTVVILCANGVIIGVVTELVRQEQGLLYVAVALIPHGIFEIPAFITASALGLMLGQALLLELQGGGDAAGRAGEFGSAFLRVVVPLLAIAAVVEAFITPAIIPLVA
ncbi:MAG: stage II sporulation protein M [Methanomicrobiaceae archaeon]|nr:stage II sporulation protein M [Methanomicrobiaceae archaeon]